MTRVRWPEGGADARVRRALSRSGAVVLALLLATPRPGSAQDFVTWLNARINDVVTSRLSERSGARQTEAPSVASGSTTLVNASGFSDLAGIAVGGGSLTQGASAEEGVPTAVTITPYAILAAILGVDPTDPFMYEERGAWRAFSITLGTATTEDAAGNEDRATLLGVKLKLWSRRSPDPSSQTTVRMRQTLGLQGAAAGPLSGALVDSLFAWAGAFAGHPPTADPATSQTNRANFNNQVLRDQSRFPGILSFIGTERVDVLLSVIEAGIEPFLEHRRATNAVLEELRGAPQLSLDVQTEIRSASEDEVRLGFAFDKGLANRVSLTANANATIVNAVAGGDDTAGATVAAGFSFALGPERLSGSDPLSLDIAGEAQFLNDRDAVWRVQGRLAIPLVEGLTLPLSVTYSNQTDAGGDDEVAARLTFSADTARLWRLLAGG